MPIRSYLHHNAAFEPAAVSAMSQALDEACKALGLTPTQKYEREQIAMRIIDLASTGVTDGEVLRNRVLFEARTKE
jgi:hypothetical protein